MANFVSFLSAVIFIIFINGNVSASTETSIELVETFTVPSNSLVVLHGR